MGKQNEYRFNLKFDETEQLGQEKGKICGEGNIGVLGITGWKDTCH